MQIEATRTFAASLEMVWKVWTDPELVKRWWGPKHFISPVANLDFREGGKSIVSMRAPKEMGGQEFYSLWVYTSIVPLSRIAFIQSLSDPFGNKIEPHLAGMPADFPRDILTIVSFKKLADRVTEMTVTEQADFGTITQFAKIGLQQSLDKMSALFD